jgi:hypothetical protein
MPSRFPGMDPFLEEESRWPWFQHQLLIVLQQLLSDSIGHQYRIEISKRQWRETKEYLDEYLTACSKGDSRVVTLLDVVSPTVKLSEVGRTVYRHAWETARQTGSNLVEIDLSLQGKPLVEYSRDNLPVWDYAVTVTRAGADKRHEIYTSSLEKPLPRFKFPLAADQRDTVLDLQAAFETAFDACGFDGQIDYGKELPATVSETLRARATRILRDRDAGPLPSVGQQVRSFE